MKNNFAIFFSIEKVSNFHVKIEISFIRLHIHTHTHTQFSYISFRRIYGKHLYVLTCPFLLWQQKMIYRSHWVTLFCFFFLLYFPWAPSPFITKLILSTHLPTKRKKKTTITTNFIYTFQMRSGKTIILEMDWMRPAAVNLIRNLF